MGPVVALDVVVSAGSFVHDASSGNGDVSIMMSTADE
jgi:hypothetical protein